jgi:hypothetical protein
MKDLPDIPTIIGVPDAAVEAIAAEPTPLLLVLHCEQHLTVEQIASIRKCWDDHVDQAKNLPPLVVLCPGMTLEAVLDPRAG